MPKRIRNEPPQRTTLEKVPINLKTEKGRTAWLEERKKAIGGSEIGAIMGMNPFASAYSVYCERKGITKPFEGNLATEVGAYMEEFVAQKFTDLSNCKVVRSNFLYRNPRYPAMHATVDRLLARGPMPWQKSAGLEIKTTSALNSSKFKGEDFPAQYYAQCVHYMTVLEMRNWFLAVLVGNHEFHIYQLTRAPEMEKAPFAECLIRVTEEDVSSLVHAANAFWLQLQTSTPPAVDGSEATGEALKVVYAEDQKKAGTADLFGADGLMSDYLQAKADAKAAAAKADKLAQEIQVRLGDYEAGESMSYRVSWKWQQGRPDYKGVVDKHPELKEELQYGKSYRKFDVKERK